jgi:cytochrome c
MHEQKMKLAALILWTGIAITHGQLNWPSCPVPVDGDFTKTTLISFNLDPELEEPLRVDIDTQGRIYIALKRSGKLLMLDPAQAYKKTVLGQLAVTPLSFHGFIGMALSPGFIQNGYIYALTTHRGQNTGPITFRVSRVTLKGSALDTTSQKTILEWPTDLTEGHTGGDLAFGPEGTLYITTGNDTWAYPSQIPNPMQTYEDIEYRTPIDEREPQFNALRSSGNTNDLRGKLLRIKPIEVPASHPRSQWGKDITYTIPAGNLFPIGKAKTRPEILAMGFRNPYTLHVEPDGKVYIADVGPQGGSAALTGPSGGDQLYINTKAANYGFPMFVDGLRPYPIYDYAKKTVTGFFDAQVPVNFSKYNTGLDTLPPVSPAAAVSHWEEALNTPGWFKTGSMSLMSGPIYHYDSKPGSSSRFPPHFDGKWIIADEQKSVLKVVTLNGDKVSDVRDIFTSMKFYNPLDMKFSPDGSLIVIEYSGWNTSDANTKVTRIAYKGSCLPVATFEPARNRSLARHANSLMTSGLILTLPLGAIGIELYDLQGIKILTEKLSVGQTLFRMPDGLRDKLLVAKYSYP